MAGPSVDHYRMICDDAKIDVKLNTAAHDLMIFEINNVRLRDQTAK